LAACIASLGGVVADRTPCGRLDDLTSWHKLIFQVRTGSGRLGSAAASAARLSVLAQSRAERLWRPRRVLWRGRARWPISCKRRLWTCASCTFKLSSMAAHLRSLSMYAPAGLVATGRAVSGPSPMRCQSMVLSGNRSVRQPIQRAGPLRRSASRLFPAFGHLFGSHSGGTSSCTTSTVDLPCLAAFSVWSLRRGMLRAAAHAIYAMA
jgi:hypothetical protein